MFIFVFATILALSSLFALVKESAPFFSERNSEQARFERLENSQEIKLGLSIYSNHLELDDCLEALAKPFGMAQPTVRRKKIFSSCQDLALNIVNMNPSYSYAWFIAAFSSVGLGQYEDFNYQLEQSQNTAPNAQWLAELRVNLAERHKDNLVPSTQRGQERDLILLVKSKRGVANIARRYVSDISFRQRIILLVEVLPEDEQAKFVRNVKEAAGQILQGEGL